MTNDAPAIQRAIDKVHEAGGGTVWVPSGRYLCSTIRLRSHVTLHLDAGATLFASTRPEDYADQLLSGPGDGPSGVLLLAEDARQIALTGTGALDGQGTADIRRGERVRGAFTLRLVLFERCQQVTVRDISLLNSDLWTLHLAGCDDVLVDGIRILANKNRINTDGIDPDGCTNVRIANCHIVTGDDCIVIKSTAGTRRASENIVVTNCTLESGASAIKLGTESCDDFRDIHISNCVIRRSSTGIAMLLKDGATMERISFTGISIDDRTDEALLDQATPLIVDIEKRHDDSRLGRIRDIAFRDLQIRSRFPALIQGAPESPIENLTLSNISFRIHETIDFAQRRKRIGGSRTAGDQRDTEFARERAALTIAHVEGLNLGPVQVMCEAHAADMELAATSLHHVRELSLGTVRRKGGRGEVIRGNTISGMAD